MDEVYAQYKDDVEILAINTIDNSHSIDYIQNNYGLTFPMTSYIWEIPTAFGITGYPTIIYMVLYVWLSRAQE